MKNRIIISTVGLIAAVLVPTVWGFDIPRAKTEARILPPNPITPVIQLNFKAQLVNDGIGDLTRVDVVVTWEEVL